MDKKQNQPSAALTDEQLINSCNKVLELTAQSIAEKEQLLKVCREIYEALNDKRQRNLIEEAWHNGLYKILNKADESNQQEENHPTSPTK